MHDLNKKIILELLESKLKDGNLEYVKGMLSVLTYADILQDDFTVWSDYLHWAEMALIQKRFGAR